jgi:hypothetical protein
MTENRSIEVVWRSSVISRARMPPESINAARDGESFTKKPCQPQREIRKGNPQHMATGHEDNLGRDFPYGPLRVLPFPFLALILDRSPSGGNRILAPESPWAPASTRKRLASHRCLHPAATAPLHRDFGVIIRRSAS